MDDIFEKAVRWLECADDDVKSKIALDEMSMKRNAATRNLQSATATLMKGVGENVQERYIDIGNGRVLRIHYKEGVRLIVPERE